MNSPSIKALFCSHMFPNGNNPFAAPFMSERAKALSRHLDIDIIAPVSYFPFIKSNLPPIVETFDELTVFHPRYLGMPSSLWNFRWMSYYLMCRSFWKNKTPLCDIAHIEWIYPDAYAIIRYLNRFHVKTVGVVHGNEAIGYFENHHHRKLYKKAIQALDRVIAVSNDLKRKMIDEYSVLEHNIFVIHNGVNLSKFPMMDQFEARNELCLPINRTIGVCIARLSSEKNLNYLINAISLLQNRAPLIYIVGSGPLRKSLESLCDSLNVMDYVKFVGPVPHSEIYKWLNSADFFCLPSQREGCPVVIHEALACGLPVVATNVGAIPDIVCKEEYGVLCSHSNAKSLCNTILEAMHKPWDKTKISLYGRNFTWEKVALQTIEVFKEVLS